MALVLRSSSSEKTRLQQDSNDITKNLPSLQFESALSPEEKDLSGLRARSHAITVSQCAQATYLVTIFNAARRMRASQRITQKRSSKLIQDSVSKDGLKIGILGCGRLGSHLAVSLLSYGMVDSADLEISTRRPETLEYLSGKGVECYYDNSKLASRCDLLFLCVLPSQLPPVCEEIKSKLQSTALLYSFVITYTPLKLKYILDFTNIIKAELSWDKDKTGKAWDYTIHVSTALERGDMVEKTSPLSLHKEASVVRTSEKFSEMMVFALVNMLTLLGVYKLETLDIVNKLVLGETEDHPLEDCLVEHDLVKKTKISTDLFPKFDLTRLTQGHTPVLRKLSSNPGLRQAFQSRYCQVFENYLQVQKYAPIK